ncbi:transporter substrate-binding domain-containing protein [Rhodoferax saidenbachensis]|uniref:Polar amino acid transport system substrate-binding protein n=1 Tax=Rhodoferax saidenbachensis TaxID=1484693 RepID=A0ABU1ZGV5_9BURK|nr:transporter substrate-binding domain-containing protein [Rhodoferax saidenbachensis]MDR7304774.1 polar amino acid transport system substrate-binding protein [Rhodoferax saidenbachensis]
MARMWRTLVAWGLVLSLWGSLAPQALAADYKMSTLEWAPYTGAALPGQGFVSATIADALKVTGTSVEIQFFPWSRAVRLVETHSRYIGFFPAYYSRERASQYLFSEPIGRSTMVFLERVDNPVKWTSYDDLQGRHIGVVRGFVNTEELDSRIAQKKVLAEEVPDDRSNILKLAAGRLELVVIDSHVYQHLVRTDPEIGRAALQLQTNAKVLDVKNLYVCFQRTPEGEKALRALNTGLRKVRPTM